MKTLAKNPPWADKLIKANWKRIATFCQKHGLPKPVVDLSPRMAMKWKELGKCGTYGCVYASSRPGTVVKLTSDLSETRFVLLTCATKGWKRQKGLVAYQACLPLVGKTRMKDPVFLLWREELLYPDGIGEYIKQSERKPTDMVDAMEFAYDVKAAGKVLAQIFWFPLRQGRKGPVVDRQKLYRDVLAGNRTPEWLDMAVEHLSDGETRSLVGAFDAYRNACTLMSRTFTGGPVGDSLLYWFDRGVALADTHQGNICLVQRENERLWAISDPGNAVFMAMSDGSIRTRQWVLPRAGRYDLAANRYSPM